MPTEQQKNDQRSRDKDLMQPAGRQAVINRGKQLGQKAQAQGGKAKPKAGSSKKAP